MSLWRSDKFLLTLSVHLQYSTSDANLLFPFWLLFYRKPPWSLFYSNDMQSIMYKNLLQLPIYAIFHPFYCFTGNRLNRVSGCPQIKHENCPNLPATVTQKATNKTTFGNEMTCHVHQCFDVIINHTEYKLREVNFFFLLVIKLSPSWNMGLTPIDNTWPFPLIKLKIGTFRENMNLDGFGWFMLNFWGQNQRFQTWLEQNAVASMLIFE